MTIHSFGRRAALRGAGLAAAALAAPRIARAQGAGDALTLGTKLELSTFDPHFFNGFAQSSSHPYVFDSLIWLNNDLRLEPALAESWRAIDENTWEFKLRRGVRFHDGSPFEAEDFLATVRRIPTVPNSPALFTTFTRSFKEVVAVDSHTIRIHTSAPNPILPLDVARILVINRAHEKSTTADFNSGRAAIGTGPYRLKAWINLQLLEVERNPTYWGPRPAWSRVTERVIKTDAARVAALLSGQIDAMDLVPPPDMARLQSDPRFALFSGPAAVVHYIAIDSIRDQSPFVAAKDGQPALARNPLRDARVRRAMSLAIDRGAICERLMDGAATPASQFLPRSFEGTAQSLEPDRQDIERARRLLAEAGVPNGFKLTLHTTADRYPKDRDIAQAVGQYWTRIGLQVTVEGVPGSVFFGQATRQTYSTFIAQYGTEEASQGPRALAHTYEPQKGLGHANRVRYSNPEVDRAIEASLGEIDPEKRNALVAKSIEAAMADQAIIPVFHPSWVHAARKGLQIKVRATRTFNALMISAG